MKIKATYARYLFITTCYMLWTLSSFAQPGDRTFSFVPFDGSGFHNNFKVYSCSVKYPNSLKLTDSVELVWKPDLKSIRIIDTLKLIKVTNDSSGIPYPYYYQGNSCLMTNILMVIRNNTDTMLITTAGADPYDLVVPFNKYDLGLPFIYPFQRGLFYLHKLLADKSALILFNSVHRPYFLSNNNESLNSNLNSADVRISYLRMNKRIYRANDTLSITLTGKVLNDRSCGGGSILWTLQRFENDKWIIAIDECCEQMACGKGPSILNNATIPLILLKDKINQNTATYPMQREIPKGKYRFVIYDDMHQVYYTEGFIIE